MTMTWVKVGRARDNTGEGEHWTKEGIHPTVNCFDIGDTRCVCAVVHMNPPSKVIAFKGGQSKDGGLGLEEQVCQTMQSGMSALEPTLCVSWEGR